MLRHVVLAAVLFLSVAHLRAVEPLVQLEETRERVVLTASGMKAVAVLLVVDRGPEAPKNSSYVSTLPKLSQSPSR